MLWLEDTGTSKFSRLFTLKELQSLATGVTWAIPVSKTQIFINSYDSFWFVRYFIGLICYVSKAPLFALLAHFTMTPEEKPASQHRLGLKTAVIWAAQEWYWSFHLLHGRNMNRLKRKKGQILPSRIKKTTMGTSLYSHTHTFCEVIRVALAAKRDHATLHLSWLVSTSADSGPGWNKVRKAADELVRDIYEDSLNQPKRPRGRWLLTRGAPLSFLFFLLFNDST